MEAEAGCVGLDRPGVDILELGSGVGWLGMCMAANLQHARSITCTEQASDGALAWLQQNVSRNSHLDLAKLRCCVCDWSWFDTADNVCTYTQESPDDPPQPSRPHLAASTPTACPSEQMGADAATCTG